jgi:hypothetical protein
MKKILMAAVAVSALSVGVANAATISNTSTVSGRNLAPAAGTAVDSYTLASEIVTTATTTATAELVISPTTATTISAGNYIVTYNITGGTFTTSPVTTGSLVINVAAGNVVSSVNTVSATSISFNVTVGAGQYLTSATLTNAIKLGVAKPDVSISGSITTADGASVDGGAIAAKKIIDYRPAFVFDGTAVDNELTIASGFEEFAGGVASTNIGTAIGFDVNTGADADDIVMISAGAVGVPAATTDLTAAVLTLTGDVSAFDADANGTAPDADTTNVFTLGAGDLADLQAQILTVGLSQQATAVAGNASDYSLGVEVEMGAGYTAPTFASIPLGSVALEGTNFYAAWVGDGTNGINYSIRLGNRAAAAVTGVSVALLNSLNETTETTCVVGTLPASGELLITSASLNACFGNFGRADLRITVQASDSSVTAKMRSVSAGVVNEQSLGGGTTTAQAN